MPAVSTSTPPTSAHAWNSAAAGAFAVLREQLGPMSSLLGRLQALSQQDPALPEDAAPGDLLEELLAALEVEARVFAAQGQRTLQAAEALDNVLRPKLGHTLLPEAGRGASAEERARQLSAQVEHLQAEVRALRATLERAGAMAADADARCPQEEPEARQVVPFETLLRNAGDRKRRGRKPLGQILVDAGLITETQRERALQEQSSSWNRHLGAILVQMGLVTEEMIAQALAAQLNLPFTRIHHDEIPREALWEISGQLALYHSCIPLALTHGELVVAMANPLDVVALDDLARITGRKIDVVVAMATDITNAIHQLYPGVTSA